MPKPTILLAIFFCSIPIFPNLFIFFNEKVKTRLNWAKTRKIEDNGHCRVQRKTRSRLIRKRRRTWMDIKFRKYKVNGNIKVFCKRNDEHGKSRREK